MKVFLCVVICAFIISISLSAEGALRRLRFGIQAQTGAQVSFTAQPDSYTPIVSFALGSTVFGSVTKSAVWVNGTKKFDVDTTTPLDASAFQYFTFQWDTDSTLFEVYVGTKVTGTPLIRWQHPSNPFPVKYVGIQTENYAKGQWTCDGKSVIDTDGHPSSKYMAVLRKDDAKKEYLFPGCAVTQVKPKA